MDKIYSRKRMRLPKLNLNFDNKKSRKIVTIICFIVATIVTYVFISKAISPIIDKQCINMAKSMATRISNEQATIVMEKYKYNDLCNITKDINRKYFND